MVMDALAMVGVMSLVVGVVVEVVVLIGFSGGERPVWWRSR